MWCSESTTRSGMRGFTLLELMMVVLLLGLLIGVGLNLDVTDTPAQPHTQLEQLSQQFTLASLEAVQGGTVWGLDFYRLPQGSGYRWLSHDGRSWQEVEPAILDADTSDFRWPSGMASELIVDGRIVSMQPPQPFTGDPQAVQPDILLLPTRESTPFTLTLQQQTRASMTVDTMGRVRLAEANDAAP